MNPLPLLFRLGLSLGLAGSLLTLTAQAALYRWVDEQGNVHYSDVIPPSSVRQGHTELRKDGIPLHTVPPARSPEQVKADEILERLRTGQERLIEQQKTADRGLLHTFPSEEELIRSSQNQLASIETMIQVTHNNIRRQEAWLASLRTYAGNIERTGKPVPQEFTDSSHKTERSIQRAQATIATREAQKAALQARLERDLNRYRQFRLSGRTAALSSNKRHADLHRLRACGDEGECDRLWGKALNYLGSQPELEIQVGDSDDLFIAAPRLTGGETVTLLPNGAPPPPDREADLVLTRIPDDKGAGATLFLELRCQAAAMGTPSCWRPELVKAIQGFDQALR